MIITWLMCILGQIMHLLAQVWTIKQAPNNAATSIGDIIRKRFIPIVVRSFICTAFFGIVFGGGLPEFYKAAGAEVPSWAAIISVLLAHTGMVGWSMSALVGFGLDSAITFIPVFKSYLPPPIDQIPAALENKAFVAGVDATKVAVKDAVEHVAEDVKSEKTGGD